MGRTLTLTRSRERFLRRISTRKGREAEAVVLIEGPRALESAFDHGAELLFAVQMAGPVGQASSGLVERLTAHGIEVVDVPAPTFRELASTDTPQGILALAREPKVDLPPGGPTTDRPRILVLDGVQEPGNVGTLVRTAAALQLERVLALDGTADPWSAKAVRASAGLAFALPLHTLSWRAAHRWLEAAGVPLLVADARGEDVRAWLSGAPPEGPRAWALLLGNEGAGPRPESLKEARARLAIPVGPGVESMNVASAGAILMWALGTS
ncbi:MAG: RNA methyltransferase [Gemmatimonadetes bacterium]|nr:RNA methyltransferase [Gemmatimonadota bacterium]